MNLASIKHAVAARARLRALLRVPRRRDEPVVPGPRLRQPPGRAARARRRTATTSRPTSPTRRSSSSATRRRSRPTSRSSSTTRPGRRTRRTTRPRSGSRSTPASSTWATRRTASSCSSVRRRWASSPTDAELSPINPVLAETSHDGKPWPELDTVRPWDYAVGGRAAAVRADGRGVRRLPQPRRPRDRPGARLPRRDRPARQHDRRARVRQRCVGRGRTERLGQREQVLQRDPRQHRGQPAVPRRPRQPEDLQPLPDRLGVGVQHALQDVEALQQLRRRHRRPDDRLVAGPASRRRARCAASTRTRSTSSRRCSNASASSSRRRCKGYTQHPIEGISFAKSFDDADAETGKETQFYSMLGTRAIWHQGWKAAAVSPAAPNAWGDFTQQRWELFDTDERPERVPRPRRAAPGPARRNSSRCGGPRPGSYQALPLESRGALDILTDRPPAARQAPQPLRLLPRLRRSPRVGGAQHPQPFVHDRRRARRRRTPMRAACSSPRAPASAATPST